MRMRWHGHACFEIQDGVTIITDPHDGKSLGIPKPTARANIILVSHDHFDHNCTRMVKGLDTEIVSNAGVTRKAGVDMMGFETFHDETGGSKRGRNTVFRFELGGLIFCHMGDLGEVPKDNFFEKLGKVDVLMIPVGNIFTIGAEQARDIAARTGARVTVPMHYRVRGLSLSIKPVDDFLSLFPEERISHIGNEIEFLPEDMPGENEVWVFTL